MHSSRPFIILALLIGGFALLIDQRHVIASGIQALATVPAGGTGLTALTPHLLLIGNGTAPVNLVSIGTAGQCLESNGAGMDPSFNACGGGGSGTVNAGTIGQLAYYPATGMAVSGENVLTSAQIPIGTPVLLSEEVLGSPAATVTFSSIPGTYRNLIITGQARCSGAVTDTGIQAQFNADTGANYSWQYMTATNATQANGQAVNTASAVIAVLSCASSPANYPGTFTIDIPNYSATTFYKSSVSHSGLLVGALSGNTRDAQVSFWWANTAAITQILLTSGSGNFVTGSTFDLYAQ
jgi:hypothetical protein